MSYTWCSILPGKTNKMIDVPPPRTPFKCQVLYLAIYWWCAQIKEVLPAYLILPGAMLWPLRTSCAELYKKRFCSSINYSYTWLILPNLWTMSMAIWIAVLLFISLAHGEESKSVSNTPTIIKSRDGDNNIIPIGIDRPEGLPLDPSAKTGECESNLASFLSILM